MSTVLHALGSVFEIAAWVYLRVAHKLYHWSHHHIDCSRMQHLADSADSIDSFHWQLEEQRRKAESARQN